MSKRLAIGGTLGTVFALAATPLTFVPALGVGAVTAATTWAGLPIGRFIGTAVGSIFGAAAVGTLTKDAEGAVAGAGFFGLASYALSTFVGPIAGGVMGYNVAVDHFTEAETTKDNDSAYILELDQNPAQSYIQDNDGNYIIQVTSDLKMAA